MNDFARVKTALLLTARGVAQPSRLAGLIGVPALMIGALVAAVTAPAGARARAIEATSLALATTLCAFGAGATFAGQRVRANVRGFAAGLPLSRLAVALAGLVIDWTIFVLPGALVALCALEGPRALVILLSLAASVALGHLAARTPLPIGTGAAAISVAGLALGLPLLWHVPLGLAVPLSGALCLSLTGLVLRPPRALGQVSGAAAPASEPGMAAIGFIALFARARAFVPFVTLNLALVGGMALDIIARMGASPRGNGGRLSLVITHLMMGLATGAVLSGPVAEFVLTRPLRPARFRRNVIAIGIAAALLPGVWHCASFLGATEAKLLSAARAVGERRAGAKSITGDAAFWERRYRARLTETIGLTALPPGALVPNPATPPHPVLIPGPALAPPFRAAAFGTELRHLALGLAAFCIGLWAGLVHASLEAHRQGRAGAFGLMAVIVPCAVLIAGVLWPRAPAFVPTPLPGTGPWLLLSLPVLAVAAAFCVRRLRQPSIH